MNFVMSSNVGDACVAYTGCQLVRPKSRVEAKRKFSWRYLLTKFSWKSVAPAEHPAMESIECQPVEDENRQHGDRLLTVATPLDTAILRLRVRFITHRGSDDGIALTMRRDTLFV